MKKPIIIDSDIEFVIVGSILDKDGVIIQSSNVGIDLIGIAGLLYNEEEINQYDALIKGMIYYSWSSYKTANNRRFKMLFCFRIIQRAEINYKERIPRQVNKLKNYDEITINFDKFIEDTFQFFNEFCYTHTGYSKSESGGAYYERSNGILTWKISSLLLLCRKLIDN